MHKIKLSRKLVISIVSVLVVIITIGFGAAVPNGLTDGLENYSGAKREAAELILDSFDNMDDGVGTVPGFTKQKVTDVTFTPQAPCTSESDYDSYTVTLKTFSWFGAVLNTHSDSVCRLSGSLSK